MRKTKIICTLGPATDDINVLRDLVENGMNVARLNFSHGNQPEQLERINAVKKVRKELKMPVAILLDTRGPEVRIRDFKDGRVSLSAGDKFTFTTRDILGERSEVSVTYDRLPQNVKKGTKILVDDGLVALIVDSTTDTDIVCTVQNSGELSNKKSLNIPGVTLDMEYLNQKDKSDIEFGIDNGIDFIAASFVRSKSDIETIKAVLKEKKAENVEIIAKIENSEGVDNAEEILCNCAGIMVARGDLGVEVPFDELPRIQKYLISLCLKRGKKVITATQMLESMAKNPRPTRAETSDVANAVYDGTTAVMLSGETSVGKYPLETLKTMVSIVTKAEDDIDYKSTHNMRQPDKDGITSAISHATVSAAHDLNIGKIIAITTSGYTAQIVSSWMPACDIIAATTSEKAFHQLSMRWGVSPMMFESKELTEDLFECAIQTAKSAGYVKTDEMVALTAGLPIGVSGSTNTLRIQSVK